MTTSEKRQNKRYGLERKVSFHFAYDFQSAVEVTQVSKQEPNPVDAYRAQTQNVSIEGLCLHTERKLNKGDQLDMKIYIPGEPIPVCLKGEVRWSRPSTNQPEEESGFDAGVRLSVVDGDPVHDSVYFDENYHVYWSNVLESILGKYRIIQQNKRNN